jgi:hypothetical protein
LNFLVVDDRIQSVASVPARGGKVKKIYPTRAEPGVASSFDVGRKGLVAVFKQFTFPAADDPLADAKIAFDSGLRVARFRRQSYSFNFEFFVDVSFSHGGTPPVASYNLAVRCVHYFGETQTCFCRSSCSPCTSWFNTAVAVWRLSAR